MDLIVGFQAEVMDPKDFYDCPVCQESILPPILQCTQGHLICLTCFKLMDSCPQCRTPFTMQLRNLGMEQLALNVQFACKNADRGCQEMLLYNLKPEHEKVCPFQRFLCPSPTTQAKCEWGGDSYEEVSKHVSDHHKNIELLEGEDVVFVAEDVDRDSPTLRITIQHCFGRDFMLVLSKQKRSENEAPHYFCFVQLIGSYNDAEDSSAVWNLMVRTVASQGKEEQKAFNGR